MLNIAIGSFLRFLKQPTLLTPAIFLVIAQAVIMTLFFSLNDTLPRFYYELFVLNIFPEANFFETLFLVLAANIEELVFLAVAVVLWFAASLWMVFSYTNFAAKGESPVKSTFSSLSSIGKIFGLAVFLVIVLVLFTVVLALLLWIGFFGGVLTLISLVAVMLWILFGAYLFFKLLFLPVEFFSTEAHITKAIKNIWSWSGKQFFSIIVFVIIISIVSNLILTIGVVISDLVSVEVVSILVIFLTLAFSSAYFGYALVNYYFSHN